MLYFAELKIYQYGGVSVDTYQALVERVDEQNNKSKVRRLYKYAGFYYWVVDPEAWSQGNQTCRSISQMRFMWILWPKITESTYQARK